MIGLLYFVLAVLTAPIKSKMRLEAENAVLRHQLTVLRAGSRVVSGSRLPSTTTHADFQGVLPVSATLGALYCPTPALPAHAKLLSATLRLDVEDRRERLDPRPIQIRPQ